jgi:DNA-directed RNA polymerase specialized sigma24 family protein
MDSTSTTLLNELRGPDARAAWDRFARLYAPLLLTWAMAWGLHDADAADCAQEVLVKVMAQFPRYERRPGAPFRGPAADDDHAVRRFVRHERSPLV